MKERVLSPRPVIPALVRGTHPSVRSGALGALDPGHKARDDGMIGGV